jgi:Ca2+-transporting ATPase
VARLHNYGENKLKGKKKKSPLFIFFNQFKDFMIIVLIIAAFIAGFVGELVDTIAIFVIVLFNGIIGFIQEYRAEKAMEALQNMSAPHAKVLRDNTQKSIDAKDLVIGDIVILEAGDIVPADLRLFAVQNLQIEEAALNGESVPVLKNDKEIDKEKLPLGDQSNMAFKGTIITYGRSLGVVVATGMQTEIGKMQICFKVKKKRKLHYKKDLQALEKNLRLSFLFYVPYFLWQDF